MRDSDHMTRCAVCGWKLSEVREEGCVRGDCAERPRPKRLYDPERAAAEAAIASHDPSKEER